MIISGKTCGFREFNKPKIPEKTPGFRESEKSPGFRGISRESITLNEVKVLRKDPKCRCEKRASRKSSLPCKLYNSIMSRYLDVLDKDATIESIQCNKPLDGLTLGDYTSDFFCVKVNGGYMVRECVDRKYLSKPQTMTLLDASQSYWNERGVTDWGIVVNKEDCDA